METKTLNGKKVKYYDSIDELPIVNYQKFNKYVLFSANVGNDINSVVQHHANILKLIDIDKNKAKLELSNTIQSLLFIENNVNTDLLAFACLIHSIDDVVVTDFSDANLKAIIESLNGEKFSLVKKILNHLKKKLTSELDAYYPEYFSVNHTEKKNRQMMIKYTRLQLKLILAKDEEARNEIREKIMAMTHKIYSLYRVLPMSGKDTYEIKYDKYFESSCMAIAQETGLDPYKLTVLQFYGLLENLHKQAKQKLKAAKKHG